ncbi:hypothetical protein SKAU_G00293130 [Synaphobranchus kaupii]|uniref:Uncharacterized protein n=1 Tax=Synaphobranchus kaupii TaxID=118154 RepID=A0A9Q1EUA4_SYNKA|nr:hypothetical protein SKAU_G00293130 [Synaphobranchus kaupii]
MRMEQPQGEANRERKRSLFMKRESMDWEMPIMGGGADEAGDIGRRFRRTSATPLIGLAVDPGELSLFQNNQPFAQPSAF